MESNGFERFSKAWKKSGLAGSHEKKYVEEDIKLFKMKKSRDFSRALNKSILFDFVQKSILMAAMLPLIWLYRSNGLLVLAFIILTGISIFLLIKEHGVKKDFGKIEDYTRELSATIAQKLKVYQSNFPSLQLMFAFTNALLVWVGSLFYFYAKYGYYRVEDFMDIIVNIAMIGFAFAISYFAHQYQYKFNLMELEENMADLDDHVAALHHIEKQKRRKKRVFIAIIILAVIGVALFISLVANYMNYVI